MAHWGTDLHVIGRDGTALHQAAAEVATATGAQLIAAETSLEDVFIQLMGASKDNMA